MTWEMLVKAPLCMSGAFSCPLGLNRSRKAGDFVTVMSVPPPIAVITPLFPIAPKNELGVWQNAQPTPLYGGPVGFIKSCFALFSLSVKFENGWVSGAWATPASNFESNELILRINWLSAFWMPVSSITDEPNATLKRSWYSGRTDSFAINSAK